MANAPKDDPPTVESYMSILSRTRRLLKSLPDAEDLASDVWLEAFINKVDRVPTRMIVNRLIDRVRHSQVEQEYLKARSLGGVPTDRSPLDGIALKELIERLIDSSKLQNCEKTVLYLRFYADLPMASIAQRMGNTIEFVVDTLNNALSTLRSVARQMELTNESIH
jgi:DNA-directed RNA polymerase specialized sigma24 family protein